MVTPQDAANDASFAARVRHEGSLAVTVDPEILCSQFMQALASHGMTLKVDPKTGGLRIVKAASFICSD